MLQLCELGRLRYILDIKEGRERERDQGKRCTTFLYNVSLRGSSFKAKERSQTLIRSRHGFAC